MNDGVLQRFRVGGANGVSTKYLARQECRERRLDRLRLAGRHASDGGVRSAQDQENQSLQSDQSQSREIRQRNQRAESASRLFRWNPIRKPSRQSTSSSRRRTRARRFSANGLSPKGLHISAMQRDEFDDEALLACKPLVLHTHATENNVTSSALAHFEREDFKLRDHPTDRAIDWKSLPTLPDLFAARVKGRESDQADYRLRQQHRHGRAVRGGGQESLRRRESERRRSRSAARLVYPGRASVAGRPYEHTCTKRQRNSSTRPRGEGKGDPICRISFPRCS